jgi:transcriptional regulator with XRE-family HTH domain
MHDDGVLDWSALRYGVRDARKRGGWTLTKLADASGIDQATIHRIENVPRYPTYHPDLDTLHCLVQAMGLTLLELFAYVARPPGTSFQQTKDSYGPTSVAASLDQQTPRNARRQSARATPGGGSGLAESLSHWIEAIATDAIERSFRRLATTHGHVSNHRPAQSTNRGRVLPKRRRTA